MSGIQGFYSNSAQLVDILTKREFLYRTYFTAKGFTANLPTYLTASPTNSLLSCGTSRIESPSSAPVGDRGEVAATLLGASSCCERRRAVSGSICVRVSVGSGGVVVEALSTSSAGEDEAAGSAEWSASGWVPEVVVCAGALSSGSALCCGSPWKNRRSLLPREAGSAPKDAETCQGRVGWSCGHRP